jgi:predicted AlkP superfamily phosphohydrolase/phosphomutase
MAPPALVEAVRRSRRRTGPEPARVTTNPFSQRTPDGDVPVLFGEVSWSQPMWYRHRWPSMPWFALPSFSDGHVRINVAGRERDGIVALDDYGRACDALEATLVRAVDPRTGEPIVDEVIRLRDGDVLAPDGPGADLVVTFRAPADSLAHPDCGIVGPFAFPRSGSHTENGFLLVDGPGIPHAELDVHPALDVPPTLLRLLGWQVPSDLQGTAMAGVVGALTD